MPSLDSFHTLDTLTVNDRQYRYFSLRKLGDFSKLPFSLKVLLENLLRAEDGALVTAEDITAFVRGGEGELPFHPARVLMQDFAGTAGLVDLAAMRDAMPALGKSPDRVNPCIPVHLVIDHSLMVDHAGNGDAFADNLALDYARNAERYAFLRWSAASFDSFAVVPPGKGICHQINLENLASVVRAEGDLAFPDSCIGTDSHTTMVNGLGVLGWGVGGIEAEAAMLGQPVSMLRPRVTGFRLSGTLREGVGATDLVLTVTQMLRAHGVVGRFVEFCGPGLAALPVADRATLANMAPEYGATCGYFPIDAQTLSYLRLTGRDEAAVALVEAYAKAQGLWRAEDAPEPSFDDLLTLDLGTVVPSLAGPRRPQDRLALSAVAQDWQPGTRHPVAGAAHDLGDGDIVIAAITSCTNTANPAAMIAAGLLARKARALGLQPKPWVKTSLAPGSRAVSDYLRRAGLQEDLDALGFYLVGYGCATCVGNTGPLPEGIGAAIRDHGLNVAAVLSGNRNFEGRISPLVRSNYLASPALVVAYALAGSMAVDLATAPLAPGVYLRDLWPSAEEIAETVARFVTRTGFTALEDVFHGDARWQALSAQRSDHFPWTPGSTIIARPALFDGMTATATPVADILRAAPIAILGDSITTDHISPVGSIDAESPAGRYLREQGVAPADFNSYGTRRGNHVVMTRGIFANPRIRNEILPGVEGGVTRHDGAILSIYDAAVAFGAEGVPLVIVAGREYGTGSARDWAAKATAAIGVRAVLAESFERIHRSNLVGCGVLPLQFTEGQTRQTLGLTGDDRFTIPDLSALTPGGSVVVQVERPDGSSFVFTTRCRIDTRAELQYFREGGILPAIARAL